MLSFPTGLPLPLRDGYGFKPVDPIKRTDMQSGLAMQRRRFGRVPTRCGVTWQFNEKQAQLFEGWCEHELGYAPWFLCVLKTPQGLQAAQVRFLGMYQGPELVGLSHWKYSATLELLELPAANEASYVGLLAGVDVAEMTDELSANLQRWYTKSWPA